MATAQMLDLLAESVSTLPPLEDLVDFVITGFDRAGKTGRSTSVVVREMFQNATASVIVVGYAVHQGQKVFQALADRMADSPSLQVRLYLDIQREPGDTSIASELVMRFAERFRKVQWPAGRPLPQVFYRPKSLESDPRERGALRAKCLIVDTCKVFVSSANFTESAQERNIEVGVLLRSPAVADRLLRFLTGLVEKEELSSTDMLPATGEFPVGQDLGFQHSNFPVIFSKLRVEPAILRDRHQLRFAVEPAAHRAAYRALSPVQPAA